MNICNTTGALYIAYAVRIPGLASNKFCYFTSVKEYITKQRPSEKVLNHIKRK